MEWATGDAMSNAQDLGALASGGTFPYSGPANTYQNSITGFVEGSVFHNYAGTANTQSSVVAVNILNPTAGQNYQGYAINLATAVANETIASTPNDNQQVIGWTKDQQIYYKLVGFNTNTQSFETWIIAEQIVPRPETFDPTGNFPNIDYNVFFTPPSGNKLVNIKIVGRWIQ